MTELETEFIYFRKMLKDKFEIGELDSDTLDRCIKQIYVLGYAEGKNKMKKLYNSS
ncbi:hypothetical protein [Virgibacillus siamensis]|uniref:hypothetical protein n=1 Tax=Virgibacillus siamensis TaxID=480071 RepID=UPI00158CF844|nr:hypothetical protein [Virgibacillus siamensis]